jgi:nitroreductase
MTLNERAPDGDRSLAAVEARLGIPLVDAMETQRAVRKVLPDPVDDAIVRRLVELALRAPTGSNGQNWEFVVVKDREIKAAFAKQYRRSWSMYGGIGRRMAGDDRSLLRVIDAVQWQVDHFEEIPVIVVACLKSSSRAGQKVPFVPLPPIAESSFYGSIYPSVQNLLLGARALGLGASLITLPMWSQTIARRILGMPLSVSPVCMVPLGWPRGRYGPTTRRPVDEVLHLDRYGQHF